MKKKGALVDVYVFAGVCVILALIFLFVWMTSVFDNQKAKNAVDEKMELLDKELLLLNYLRMPFIYVDGTNFADYIVTSNFFLANKNKYGYLYPDYEPEYFDYFRSKTLDYFNKAMRYGKMTWGLKISAIEGRNAWDNFLATGDVTVNKNVEKISIQPDEKVKKSKMVAVQVIPSPDDKVYLVELYQYQRRDGEETDEEEV